MMIKDWLHRNCKLAGGLSGTDHCSAEVGTVGYSRLFDMAYHFLSSSCKLTNISKACDYATFGFDKEAKPEHQIRLSWAGNDDQESPSIKIKIEENTADKPLTWEPLSVDNLVLRTDSLHASAPVDFTAIGYAAFRELERRTNRGLTDRGRWGLAIGKPARQLAAWVGSNCKLASATRTFHCVISVGTKVVWEDSSEAVSDKEAASNFWWRVTGGDKAKIADLKRKGYKCVCTELPPIAPDPPKPKEKPMNQGLLF